MFLRHRISWRALAAGAVALCFFAAGSGCGADGLGGGSDDDDDDGRGGSSAGGASSNDGGSIGPAGNGGNTTGTAGTSASTGPSGSGTSTGSGSSASASGSGSSSASASSGSASGSASSAASSGSGGGDGNCCYAHSGVGCDSGSVESCVCSFDPYCCNTAWDGQCASEAANDCGACGGSSSASSSSVSSSASSGSGGGCLGFGQDCWSSPQPCCSGYFCSNATGECLFDSSSTSSASGGGCSNPTGYGGLGCDPIFTQGCSQIGCSCCESSGIGHCC